MKKKILELVIMVVSIIFLGISVEVFGLENTTVVTLGLIISKIMGTEIWNELK
jgi:hypothetical protein